MIMPQFYYHPLSPIARRVWLALIEKQIPFEPIVVNLAAGEQLAPSYLAIQPFHHIPAIAVQGMRVIESLAILDYLEAEYPHISLSATGSTAVANMRMAIMVTVNEIMPKIPALALTESPDPDVVEHLTIGLGFLSEILGKNLYFGGEHINLADIVVGATIPVIDRLGIGLSEYPNLSTWLEHINQREAWQQTKPSPEDFSKWRQWLRIMVQRRRES